MAKSKWEEVKDKLILIEGWARDGLTNEQIAENLCIGKTTFYKILKEHSELSELLKKNKEIVDYEVENALLKSALGHTVTYLNQTVTKDGDVIEYKETVYIPPKQTAQIFWLKNRKPEKWRDRVEIDNDNQQTLDRLDEVLKNIGGVV